MKAYLHNHWKTYTILFCIIFLGAFFRLYNLNWDQGFHLHPDERFLTMVGMEEQLPRTFFDYLNPELSTLNPSVLGFPFFVYGTFPLTITFLVGIFFHFHTYDNLTLLGRALSALFDVATLLIVYKTAEHFATSEDYKKTFPLLATFFYAIAVLPIQLSHFYTVDLFANFFGFTSFYFILEFFFTKKTRFIFLSSIALGLAVASKISALFFFPLNTFLLFATFFQFEKWKIKTNLDFLTQFFTHFFQYLLVLYVSLRLADPYMFASGNFLIPILNKDFLNSLSILYSEYSPQTVFPPAFQWINKIPVIFGIQNIILFGLGIPYAVLTVFGAARLAKQRMVVASITVLWTLLTLCLQGMQFAQTMRYFIFLYPFFALFAGAAAMYISQRFGRGILIPILLLSSLWTFFFFSIYTRPHSRVAASLWINAHIPNGSTILSEYWDDPLPLFTTSSNQYASIMLPVFDPDTSKKWGKMNDDLQKGDYLILSSNRGWGTIESLPRKFPQASIWYSNLVHNKLSYKEVAEFHSYPSLSYLGIPLTIPDAIAEEAFTVYDHPTVLIFQHQ